MYLKVDDRWNRMYTPQLDIYDGVLSTPNEDRMKNLHPRKVDVSTNYIEAHKPFGVSSYGVRFLVFYGFLINFLC
jgi:hypothetical protein